MYFFLFKCYNVYGKILKYYTCEYLIFLKGPRKTLILIFLQFNLIVAKYTIANYTKQIIDMIVDEYGLMKIIF